MSIALLAATNDIVTYHRGIVNFSKGLPLLSFLRASFLPSFQVFFSLKGRVKTFEIPHISRAS